MQAAEGPGRYTIGKRIAAGGMGEVYMADAAGLGGATKRVAVKLLKPHDGPNDERTRLFVEEAKLVFGLSHANVVHTFDVGLLDDRYFIAMEYVHGVDLRGLFRFGGRTRGTALPVKTTVPIMVEALKGLDYAHRARDTHGLPMGVIHQDISPSNILLSTEGEVKIADFGVAIRAFRDDPGKNHVRGKYPYMAPEQLRGEELDQRVDVFAMGVVLYEALIGKRPFGKAGPTDREFCEGAQAAISDASDVPGELAAIVAKSLSHDRKKRFRRAGEMRAALEELAQSSGILLSTASVTDLVRRARRDADQQKMRASGVFEGARIDRSTLEGPISQFRTARVKHPAAESQRDPVSSHELRRVDATGIDVDILVDETRWPLVIISGAGPVTLDMAHTNALHDVMDELFGRKTRFAFVLDGRGIGMPDAKARNNLASFAKTREHLFQRYVVADASVFESAPVRGVVTAVNWMAPPKHPVRVFGDIEDAIAWATSLLTAEGLTIA